MNRNKVKHLVVALSLVAQTTWASEPVKWVGTIQEEWGYHTPQHEMGHDLEFIRQSDGEAFDVVDSDALLKLHKEKEKNLLVEVSGELTNRFLFWGGNLIVKDFKVIQELEPIVHREQPRAPARSSRSDRR